MPTIHLLITGKVQGVFYRATAKKMARKLNLTGWIKNNNDDSVEAMVTGKDEQLIQFTSWCNHGPDNASVEDIIITPQKETLFDDFEIVRN